MFYFIQKLPVTPLKINLPSPIWNWNFLTCHNNFLLKFSSPNLEMGCKYHDIAKSAGSQTNNKSSKHDSMTPRILQNHLSKDLPQQL